MEQLILKPKTSSEIWSIIKDQGFVDLIKNSSEVILDFSDFDQKTVEECTFRALSFLFGQVYVLYKNIFVLNATGPFGKILNELRCNLLNLN